MSDKVSSDRTNGSDSDNDFRVSALLLRNDMKKRLHNNIEKRRKDKINTWIHKLAELLPFKEPKRDSKVHILENMYHYVNELKEKCNRLMFVSTTALNDIHVKEIHKLTKKCKELEEKNKNYFKLLQTAGISPNSWPQDIQFERPTKYSKKITEQQLNEFLAKNSDKIENNKRSNDSDEDTGEPTPAKKVKLKKMRKKKEKENKVRDLKNSPPTPVLPKPMEQVSPNSSSSSCASSTTSSQTTNSGPLIILNDQNLPGMQTAEEPRLIVNTSNNAFNGLNTLQIQSSLGQQPMQILGQTLDTNFLSRQLLFNLNPPPPQPQTTAVLLPNGQLLPIITQPQPQQQPLIYATNQGIFLTNPNSQTQNSIFGGQTTNIMSNIKTNTINLTNESSPKSAPESKPKGITTTIEAVAVPEKATKKTSKSVKKQLFVQKVKNSKKDKRKQVMNDENDDELYSGSSAAKVVPKDTELKRSETKNKTEKSLNTSKDKIRSRSPSDKNAEKNEKSAKNMNNSKSKQVLTEVCGTTDTKGKESASCDILAKATQSIFSPPPNASKHMPNSSSKKGLSITNKNKANDKSADNRKDIRINDNKTKSMDNNNNKRNNTEMGDNKSVPNRVDVSNQNEVIGAQSVATAGRSTTARSGSGCSASSGNSVTSANTSNTAANKANADVINDTNKNDNYVRNTTVEHKSKLEKSIAAGNKAENSRKAAINTDSVANSVAQDMIANKTDSLNQSTPEPSNSLTVEPNDSQSNANHHIHQSFAHNVINDSENRNSGNSSANGLEFGFTSHQNQTNNENPNGDTQAIITESELPSILLSLNDANEVSTESVHSVSNSSLPAFLSLSPEHLNEYLPKDNINNNTEADDSARDQTVQSNNNEIQYRLNPNETNVEQSSNVRLQDKGYSQLQQKEQQSYNTYRKPNEHSVAPTTQTESRTSYTSNFPTIPTLINNDYPEFVITPNKSMFASNNTTNYLDNLNPKTGSQNSNLFQFPLQNDNSLMPLYPMHSYPISNYLPYPSNTSTSNANRDPNSSSSRPSFLSTNESQSTPVNSASKVSQNASNSFAQNNGNNASQVSNQTSSVLRQQPKPTSTAQQSNHNPSQSQSNGVPLRTQRNPSTEQLPPQPQPQRHPSQTQHTSPVSSNASSTNKSNANSNPVQYSNHTFSSYSAEALIRQNEPPIQQMANNDQNRYNTNAGPTVGSVGLRIPPQSHSSNISFSDRNSSRSSISYSAESLIQSNQISNKQRDTETEPINSNSNNENNRISYYQTSGHNNNSSNNLVQRPDQNNNSNNLFNFDHSINSRIMSSSHNYTNSYPQISHLPDIRSSTVTTSAESLFPIAPSVATVNSNSNRNLPSNITNSIANASSVNSVNTNPNAGQLGHNLSTPSQPTSQTQQHSPAVYQSNSNQNSNPQQSKRTTNNSFTSVVNPFIQSNEDNYQNPNHSTSYQSSGQPILESNTNANISQYARNSRNTDFRFSNCLQPSNQNPNPSMTAYNNPNAGCFFTNPAPNTIFPSASTTPFPPLLPSAASPFDPTFGTTHRPPMFLHDFNPSFVNSSAPNPLPAISGPNFNMNSSASNSNNNSNAVNKTRETQPTNSRSTSNLSRSPQSKHSKLNSTSGANTKTKKQNNANKQTDSTNNTNTSSTSRHSSENYLSMTELMTPTNQTSNRYPNFSSNSQTTHNTSRQPVASSNVSSSHSTSTKNVTSTVDNSSSYSLFRPQSQNNSSNVSSVPNFSVNSLHNPNRSASSGTTPHFSSSSGHHSSHATNFHLSNIFPDINSNSTESLSLSPMKFPPPVAPMVPPPVAPPLSQSAMDTNAYPNHHSGPHHQNLYHSHHSSARISTPHNAFNSFLSSGTSTTHNSNSHSFDAHITPNARTGSSAQMSGLTANSSHPTTTFTPTHPQSHHSYPNILF